MYHLKSNHFKHKRNHISNLQKQAYRNFTVKPFFLLNLTAIVHIGKIKLFQRTLKWIVRGIAYGTVLERLAIKQLGGNSSVFFHFTANI